MTAQELLNTLIKLKEESVVEFNNQAYICIGGDYGNLEIAFVEAIDSDVTNRIVIFVKPPIRGINISAEDAADFHEETI